jgi:hypothetical protein
VQQAALPRRVEEDEREHDDGKTRRREERAHAHA